MQKGRKTKSRWCGCFMSRSWFSVGAATSPVWWHRPCKATGLLRWCLLCGKCEVAPGSAQEGPQQLQQVGELRRHTLVFWCLLEAQGTLNSENVQMLLRRLEKSVGRKQKVKQTSLQQSGTSTAVRETPNIHLSPGSVCCCVLKLGLHVHDVRSSDTH